MENIYGVSSLWEGIKLGDRQSVANIRTALLQAPEGASYSCILRDTFNKENTPEVRVIKRSDKIEFSILKKGEKDAEARWHTFSPGDGVTLEVKGIEGKQEVSIVRD
jgi:hypothetical protein